MVNWAPLLPAPGGKVIVSRGPVVSSVNGVRASLFRLNANGSVDPTFTPPGIVIAGGDETTHVSVFTVGRATAFDPTGTYNILAPPSATRRGSSKTAPT